MLATEDISDAKILIVDDLLLLRELIKNYLAKEGFKNLYTAENGVEALEMIQKIHPDLLILDILMPEMNGFEVCRKIRSDPHFGGMPILVQTGVEESEERLEVFKVGATDLVLKPINGSELVARVRVHLQNVYMQRRQQRYHQRMVDELAAASRIQESLLPSKEKLDRICEKTGLRVDAYYQASSELGGDFWGLRLLPDNRLALYMADFSGHGVVSALNTFRLHTVLNQVELEWGEPAKWMSTVNKRLCQVTAVEHFATFIFAVIDPENNKLTYSAAAAPPIVCGTLEGEQDYCDTSGLPLGISEVAEYNQIEMDFEPGQYLFLYSDALIETRDENGKLFEEEEILDVLSNVTANSGVPRFVEDILEAYPGRNVLPAPDDLTLVSLYRGE